LRPGGTLAVFTYYMLMFPDRSQHLHDDFARIRDNLVVATQNPDVEVSETPFAKIIK
jgi:hypothetical protein